jgi:hypothetical protein
MARLRRTLSLLTAAWLLCQATATLAPAALQMQAGGWGLQCECARGAMSTCAIHHRTARGSKLCLIRSADDTAAVVLSSLFGVIGLVSGPTALPGPASAGDAARAQASPVAWRPLALDPPPPRA